VQDILLEDHVWTEIEGVPVFAGVPLWNPMHDLLVHQLFYSGREMTR